MCHKMCFQPILDVIFDFQLGLMCFRQFITSQPEFYTVTSTLVGIYSLMKILTPFYLLPTHFN